MSSDDENFMREALLEAKKAFALGEVPVGAVLVSDGKIIARAHNVVEQNGDASCHAELLCLQRGAKELNNWRLLECTLYCTLEPCAMCAGAMTLFRIQRLVYGAPDLRYGSRPIDSIEVTSGVCEEEAGNLLKGFFRKRRKSIVPACLPEN
ncbi:MAG: tRNA-specific adenosine deaminase [Chlamydiae bacterium]|nr:tRNA-specific adenosine deaminase [Chlamydiota bacterium]